MKQVFPSLRRRAKSRGVDIVDVDLRWGVTAEQTERGETLPLCLAEIDNCRPYFISLLGQRYGWVPPADFYQPALLERQPWLKERMGGASVTELEILHGVLRNPEMAGHAMFYLRDPAYAQAQQETGWVAENPTEQQRLQALKEQIRASGFPVVEEGLATPQAIAERIEADLWAVIEREHPEQEPPDALQREGQRHSDYRRSRTGLYLGGAAAIEQLERWIAEGEQRILITGESGAGKSALIANWLEAHLRSYPQDLVHAHHLGCTNDASAVRPLLGRLIDTASQLLVEEQQISRPIEVPQDWWELVFKVGEVFALLSSWCQKQGCRWILVVDGLDRLAEDDQQALPWIPTTIPPGIHVVASSLDCPARSILQDRQYRTHEIGPLGKAEQQQLIERYLSRYTKQLESGLQQKILEHKLAGSPLFLKVLLEELRQCAWFDTLADQLETYLAAETIDGLYTKVLERLELDGHGEASRKALTALWASRAGLSETELLAITGLAQLEWAPVDLALGEAFGRNGDRLVFDHDYLRLAVQDRHLPSEDARRQAHCELADWFIAEDRKPYEERCAKEHPWQLMKADRLGDLCGFITQPALLALASAYNGYAEVFSYWRLVTSLGESAREKLEDDIRQEILFQLNSLSEKSSEGNDDETTECHNMTVWFADELAGFMEYSGLYGELLLELRRLSIELEEVYNDNQERVLDKTHGLGCSLISLGFYKEAETVLLKCLKSRRELLGDDHLSTLATLNNLAIAYNEMGQREKAKDLLIECKHAMEKLSDTNIEAINHIDGNLALLHINTGNLEEAEALLTQCISNRDSFVGIRDEGAIKDKSNLSSIYYQRGDLKKAEEVLLECLQDAFTIHGEDHPLSSLLLANLGKLKESMREYDKAEYIFRRCLDIDERVLGGDHPNTNNTRFSLANLYSDQERYTESIPLRRVELEAATRRDGRAALNTLASIHRLARDLYSTGDMEEAEQLYREALIGRITSLGDEDTLTMATRCDLACCLSDMEHYGEAIEHRRIELAWRERVSPVEQGDTLRTTYKLACDLMWAGEEEEAEVTFVSCLSAQERILGLDHVDTLRTAYELANLLSDLGRQPEAVPLRRRELAGCKEMNGNNHPGTLLSLHRLAIDLRDIGEVDEAESLFRGLVERLQQVLEPDDFGIGLAFSGLSKTLEKAGRLNEALDFAQQAEAHRLKYEGPDAWVSNRSRLDLAGVLHKLERFDQAISLLDELQASMTAIDDLDQIDQELLAEAAELRALIQTGGIGENG